MKKPVGKHLIEADLETSVDELGDDVEAWITAALDWDALADALEVWPR
jgi:hypothetical protein